MRSSHLALVTADRPVSVAPHTVFVLGGGGNLGAVQVGQLRALIERGIVPDTVAGCSVGALNAASVACDPTIGGIDRLAGLWQSLERDDIFPTHSRRRGPWLFIRNGLSAYSDRGLRSVLQRWLPVETFEQTTIGLSVVATALRTGLEHWFSEGPLMPALLASTALPGFLPPVEIAGEDFIDGGVVNNVPMSRAYELGAKRIVVLDVGHMERDRREPRRPYEVMMHAVSIARAHRFRSEMGQIPDGVELIRMPIVDPGKLRFDDFSRTEELIDRAYDASGAFLDRTPALVATA